MTQVWPYKECMYNMKVRVVGQIQFIQVVFKLSPLSCHHGHSQTKRTATFDLTDCKEIVHEFLSVGIIKQWGNCCRLLTVSLTLSGGFLIAQRVVSIGIR